MKISNKITFLVLFLLAVLAINSMLGANQISRIGQELEDVINKDSIFIEIVTSISHLQLEKTVLIERMIRISEEITYEDVVPARRKHLLDQSSFIKKGFDELSTQGALKIVEGKDLIKRRKEISVSNEEDNTEFELIENLISKIEKAHINYDMLVGKIFSSINAENYQLSFDDIKEIRRTENSLSNELESLLSSVQDFATKSLFKAKRYEEFSRDVLRFTLLMSIVISSIISFLIIRRISKPLRKLELAAKTIGEGGFDINIDHISKDEIGKVANAFNIMAEKLSYFKITLENKNKELASNLKITEEQKKDLEKINQELDRFAHTVSHDLRAPLTGIAGYSAYLSKNYADILDKRAKDCVDAIGRSAFRMNNLINDLLALSKISRIKNPYESVKISEILIPILERLEFTIKELNVDMKIHDKLPEIVCDKIKLGEVFLNLINNAIKFSSKNNIEKPKIEIGYIDKDEHHQFFIKDNGIGIAPEHHEEIFGIFKRLHNVKEYEGTGAGLSIVKSVIDDHGGKIWIESELGKGAIFWFTIPKKIEQIPENLT